jgi:hypothetical protein
MLELLKEIGRLNDPLWDDELFFYEVQYWPMAFDIDHLDGRWITLVGTDGSLLTFAPEWEDVN